MTVSAKLSLPIMLSTVLVACGGGGGGSDTKSSQLSVSVTIQASTSEAKVNQNVTLTWSATNASSCTASGGWSGTKGINGSETLMLPATGDNTFSIQCSGQNASPASTAVVIRGLPLCTHTSTSDGILVSSPAELQTALTGASGNGRDDTIYLAAGVYKPSKTFVYDAKGTTETLSLIGCSAEDVVIDGQDNIRLFHFQKNGVIGDATAWQRSTIHNPPYPTLRVIGITIQNGNEQNDFHIYGYSGAGMLVERYHAEFDSVRFLRNKGYDEGGAVNGVANVTVKNSVFKNNYAKSSNGAGGGAAMSVCGSITISNSTFESNDRLAVYRGICMEADYSKLPIAISGSTFGKNSVALYALGDYGAAAGSIGDLTITNSVFESNIGTAVITRLGNVTINDTKFINNGFQSIDVSNAAKCVDYDFYPCDSGGAIKVDNYLMGGGVLTIVGSEFAGNYAPNYGGAIAMGGVRDCQVTFQREGAPCNPEVTGLNPDHNILVKDTIFADNRSHRGAAIAIAKFPLGKKGFQRGNITIEGGSFTNNTAALITPAAGVVPVDELQTTVIAAGGSVKQCGVKFSGNSADVIVAAKGGQIVC